ncbi:zinc finger CCCH domain-containing protein ZFN-like isoform X1 [Iris pallida]|uniref:Zinc finger CCCH domain-containing protein ZFN-like isoform X1 n=1 Tax=Iris pallida TaxID=29817 RepID=A0AAX6HYD0_IRIPA|nr:zinc finger CCCH domain-containing protein ZFN-like isoform X1 [Iris pallida]
MSSSAAAILMRTSAAAVPPPDGSSSSIAPELDEEAMWQMSLRGSEAMESGPYPERPGEADCAYYIRTGLCRFGVTCKFNHPPNRKLAVATARLKGGFPERAGQPECQYYLQTGTCKFGATCKFHHPRDKAGIAGRVQLNILGYPHRPDEKECAYYLRTGQCKFGNTCKFHHPQPSNPMVSLRDSVYPPVHSPTTPGQQSYTGRLTSWHLSRASFIPSPRWQAPSSYAQLILPQGLVQIPGWNPYSGQLSSVSSPENQQQTTGNTQFYGTSRQNETTGSQGTFSSYRPSSIPMGLYALQRENVFPERPDQPECQFYMKTGDCKFGAVCKFHHPRERVIPIPNCVLNPLGLPLRPGEPLCLFYSRYGMCKFGPNCKFDHPFATYSPSTASAVDVPVVRRLLGSTSGPPDLTLPSERPGEAATGKSRSLSFSESRQISSGDENIETEGPHATSSIGQITSALCGSIWSVPRVQLVVEDISIPRILLTSSRIRSS